MASKSASHQLASISELPDGMRELFEAVVADSAVGLAAAVQVARYRKRHGYGPTFSELFGVLFTGSGVDWDRDRRLTFTFRHHLAVHWKRAGWIRWDGTHRSLATGPTFRRASAEHTLGVRRGKQPD